MAETKTPGQTFIEKCYEFLADEGYRPKMDGKMINFKKEGQPYWINFFGDPQNLFVVTTIYSYDDAYLNRIDALELANENNGNFFINANINVVRSDPNEDDTAIFVRSVCYTRTFLKKQLMKK